MDTSRLTALANNDDPVSGGVNPRRARRLREMEQHIEHIRARRNEIEAARTKLIKDDEMGDWIKARLLEYLNLRIREHGEMLTSMERQYMTIKRSVLR